MKKNKSLLVKSPLRVPLEQWQIKQGAQVYLVRRSEIPAINIDILFRAGSCRDGKKWGLSYLTNTLLNQGTQAYNADEIAEKFSDVGALFKIYSSKDSACAGLKSLSEKKYFDSALKLFLEILHSVNFPGQAIKRRQKQLLNTIKTHEQMPGHLAQQAFYAALYNKHVYAHPMEGTKKSVTLLNQKDIKNFYHQYYVLENATIIIVGDVSLHQAESIVSKIAGVLPSGKAASPLNTVATTKKASQSHIEFPSEQANVWLGHVGLKYGDIDYYPLLVGNDILGGSSVMSRLFTQVRGEHGLVYGINSGFQFLDARGSFSIHFATQNTSVKKSLKLIQAILDRYIEEGPTKAEFLLAKKKLINEFPLSLTANADIEDYIAHMGFYKLPLDYLDTYQAKIAALTLEEVRLAIKRHIYPDKMIQVVVGPTGKGHI
jgi:zinc protease